ncbi:transporter [Streptomyces sp. AC495_CC817]|uniref:transporter n=1 Tax=Streptomyces sp. AC495_CC817 TaxID=2823900 RepID=UPI001C255198|nr:transporter [Streptomyces sp. AC495_CC817]
MIDILFLVADLWLIFAGFFFGWRFIRRFKNYFLGIECLVVATSATNFLLWSLLSGDPNNPMYTIAYFLDAFSRSFGFTLVLILGLMMVTHNYRPRLWHEIGAFGLAFIGGALLVALHQDGTYGVGPATFFMVTNVIASLFVFYFAVRVWQAGARGWAMATAIITLIATYIALVYDFFPWPFDDELRTAFYAAALATWGTQGFVYYFAYKALHAHNARVSAAGSARIEATRA